MNTKTEHYITQALPCPFCGSTDLTPGYWSLDDGEVDAIECDQCYAGAPVTSWNNRAHETEQTLIQQLSSEGKVPEHLKNL